MEARKLTEAELETFLERVVRWNRDNTFLNHTCFETEAKEYVRKNGYTFTPANSFANGQMKNGWKVIRTEEEEHLTNKVKNWRRNGKR